MQSARATQHSWAATAGRLILLLALLVRVEWGLQQPNNEAVLQRLPDQAEYLQLGRNLLHGRGLFMVDPHFGDRVYAYRMPGYPLLIAACGGWPRVIRLVQAVLDTGTVLAVYLLARRWLSQKASTVAMAVVAVNPFMIYFTGLILSETLFTALLAWSLVLVSTGARSRLSDTSDTKNAPATVSDKDATPFALLGIFVAALSVLVRPSAAGLTVILAIAVAVLNRKRGRAYPRWWPLPPATTGMVLVILVLLPWAARNKQVLGTWVWTATDGGATLYDGFNDYATGASDQSRLALIPGLRSGNEVQRDEYLTTLALRWAAQHPAESVRLAAMKVLRTWSPLPLNTENGSFAVRLLACLYSLPLFALVVCGLWRRGGGHRVDALPASAKMLLMLPALYFTVIHAMSVGSLRYRIPCEAPMAVLAASGLTGLLAGRWKTRATPNEDFPGATPTVSSETDDRADEPR